MHDRGAGGDISSGADLMAEEIFVRHLHPFGTIDSEEAGIVGSGRDRIYLDPIDGSDNFLSGLPYYGSSIALEREGKIVVGIVTNLANGTYLVKSAEGFIEGAFHHERTYAVQTNPNATVGIFERGYRSRTYARRLKEAKIKYRIPGAVALSLAYAHRVRFVLFEGEMRPYDIAAGLWMCEDLCRHSTEDLTIICHNREDLTYLKKILLEERI